MSNLFVNGEELAELKDLADFGGLNRDSERGRINCLCSHTVELKVAALSSFLYPKCVNFKRSLILNVSFARELK